MKLSLEGLEKRIVPTAAAEIQPSPAALVATMVQQGVQRIVTVENAEISIDRAETQVLAQVGAIYWQQVNRLFGSNPSPQNQSLHSPMQQAGNASGSGSSATIKPQGSPDGNVSGTGTSKSKEPGSNAAIKPQGAPDGPDIQLPAGYLWDPTVANAQGQFLASTAVNWDYNGQSQVGVPNPKKPGQTPDAVTFDPIATTAPGLHSAGGSNITWDYTPGIALTINLGGKSAYSGTQTINSNVVVDGSVNGNAASDFHLNFLDASSVFQIDGNSTLTTMHLGGSPSGLFVINSGTTWIAGNPGAGNPAYEELEGVSFVVNPNASLIDLGYSPLKFWANSVKINVQGTMDVWYGPNASNTQIDINGNSKDYIDVSGNGVLTYMGWKSVKDTFSAPVLVEGSGIFQVNGGKLIVQNIVPGQANNASVYLNAPGGGIRLFSTALLECDNDYYQAQGFLATKDANDICGIQDGLTGNLGTATIAGGSSSNVYIANTGKVGDYGELDIICKQLNFGGTYGVNIAGNAGGANTCDNLDVLGAFNFQGSSALSVYVANQPQVGQKLSWEILDAARFINNQFNTESSIPNTQGLKYGPVQGTTYNVTYGI